MLPLRAILPTTPDPGSTSRRFSSSTTESCTAFTVGPPFIAVLPFCTTVYPLAPPSDEPTASDTAMFGNRSKNWSFTDGENTAAVLPTAKSEDTSYSSPRSCIVSTSGRPIASPVIMIMLTPSSPTSCHTRCASNFDTRTILLPTKLPPMTPHWVAPCMSGAIGNEVVGPWARPFSTIASGRSTFVPPTTSMPPPSAKKTSSCRHTTPLGMPVVPPV
jgi:hypothetical protein